MKRILPIVVLLSCFQYDVHSTQLPGPLVYVVTPSSRPPQIDMAKSAPFYYRNWIRRMDTPSNSAPTTTTTEKTKTPDLIFAEFDSDNNNMKSIRNLLEKEKIESTTTSLKPIYVPDSDKSLNYENNNELPQSTTINAKKTDMTDYFALYNNLYNSGQVYVPSAPTSTVISSTSAPAISTTTIQSSINNVENIWHIIDKEKHDQISGTWEEQPVSSEQITNNAPDEPSNQNDENKSTDHQTEDDVGMDENFALPGFSTNTGNGAENESRAIRTDSNIRFPYINLKPFKVKNSNTKKMNNMFNLDSFTEIKNPVRGEVQDTFMVPARQPIDRYNPAQPYIPEYGIGVGTRAKPSVSAKPAAPDSPLPPVRMVSNLIPPPLPPAPQLTDGNFPTPSTYESFPPFAPAGPGPGATFSFPSGDSSPSDDDDQPPPPSGYNYKAPTPVASPANSPPAAPSVSSFVPTLPPISKPFTGYSYDKPPVAQDDDPSMDMNDKPDFHGYHYSKPAAPPSLPVDHPAPSYGHHDAPPPSYQPEYDYPELIFNKPHKEGDDMKGNDMGMMPPPPPAPAPDMKPDNHGFPHDFPGYLKYAHDFDDHDYHHYEHPTTTTTTTTEMPRVNRYSYYYLGKKLYYLPLYFSVYFVVYVGALIIKAVLRHKITYPNSYRPNSTTASFFSKRSIESHLSNENLHEITGRVTKAIATAAEQYVKDKSE